VQVEFLYTVQQILTPIPDSSTKPPTQLVGDGGGNKGQRKLAAALDIRPASSRVPGGHPVLQVNSKAPCTQVPATPSTAAISAVSDVGSDALEGSLLPDGPSKNLGTLLPATGSMTHTTMQPVAPKAVDPQSANSQQSGTCKSSTTKRSGALHDAPFHERCQRRLP
jgi:hypothetical protein